MEDECEASGEAREEDKTTCGRNTVEPWSQGFSVRWSRGRALLLYVQAASRGIHCSCEVDLLYPLACQMSRVWSANLYCSIEDNAFPRSLNTPLRLLASSRTSARRRAGARKAVRTYDCCWRDGEAKG